MAERHSRRSVLLAGAAAVASTALAGCGAADPGGAAAGSGATAGGRVPAGTVLAYLSNHNQSEGELIKASMDGFGRRFPGARVDFQVVDGNAMQKLQAMLVAGTPPDMFRTGGTAWAQVAERIRQATDPLLAEHQQAIKAGK